MMTAYLAAWAGPVEHADEGYSYWSVGKPEDTQKHVQQVVFLPGRTGPLDNNTIKWFIMNHGAVYAQMRYYGMFYNEIYKNYYMYGEWGGTNNWPNVSVTIVGWDDNYDRNRFVYPAPGNGAFIAKHSRGWWWGDDGYFRISYYDTELKITACFNNAEDITNYGANYQYDPMGATSQVGNGTTVYWGANVFTARDANPLEAVSFYTNDAGTGYEIYVYRGAGDSPVSGTLATAKNGVFPYPGYYTVKLDSPVPLNPGERFSVVIRFDNSTYTSPVVIEAPVPEYSDNAEANEGESYISGDGRQWRDLTGSVPESNVCIKAFTAYSPTGPTAVVNMQARSVLQKIWLISKFYGEISFTIENPQQLPLHHIVIYKRDWDRPYYRLVEISPDELDNGSYTYVDKYLRLGEVRSYHVTLYDASGAIIGKSNEQTFEVR
jgi:hypothetical protein